MGITSVRVFAKLRYFRTLTQQSGQLSAQWEFDWFVHEQGRLVQAPLFLRRLT